MKDLIQNCAKLCYTFLLLVTISCSENSVTNELPPEEVIENLEGVSYLALGDSYTIGEGVPEKDRWPLQLGEKLEENDIAVASIEIIARTGWTTGNLINAMDQTDLKTYDLVSLLIGVNNQYQRRPIEEFKEEFDELITRALRLAIPSNHVFVVSIPDYGVTPFGSSDKERIAAELDAYNAYMKGRCDTIGIPFIDITEISRQLGGDSEALASDRLHPSGFQYGEWVKEILPVVMNLLE